MGSLPLTRDGGIEVLECLRCGVWKEIEISCCPSRLPQLLCNGPCCDWLDSSLMIWRPRFTLSRHLDNYEENEEYTIDGSF
jgi:hypothetical protein